ncbi:fibroleukin-like isoform X1 [Physella acuta]|uniref:fibroleukin-like isoform X1 n=1 Tax=Physella acuta TaxID=109671 RepID=UPI0027DB083B|nr:fibroleukin-like isoform X1 [Physella acuta]
MSAVFVTVLVVLNAMLTCGLKVDMTREHFFHGKSLFCAQLQCTENITEDTQMSALVNMSVYRISEPEGKILLASISGSDSKVRDYKISGVLSEGKLSKHHGELVLSFSNTSACNLHQYKCQVYFTNKTGDTGMLENRTTSYEREKIKKSVLLMNLKAETLNYVKTVDTMYDFLKSFEDPEKLKDADVSMSLQMSHSDRDWYSDDTAQIPSSTELNNSNKHISSNNATDMLDAKINNITQQMQTVNNRLRAIDVVDAKINNITQQMQTVNNRLRAIDVVDVKINNITQQMQTVDNKLRAIDVVDVKINNITQQMQTVNNRLRAIDVVDVKINKITQQMQTVNDKLRAIDVVDVKINNITQQMQTVNDKLRAIDVKLNEAITRNNQTNRMIEALNTTVQESKKTYNMNPLLSRTTLQCKKNDKTDVPERTTVRLGQDKLALCDTKTDGGGWIIFQRRVLGDVNFTRDWNAYKHGFGSLVGDFWLGNDWISNLTMMGYNELRIDMTRKGIKYYAHYDHFKVDNEAASYKIYMSSFSGNVKDKLSYHHAMKFSTFDRDNDWLSENCAGTFKGGWWFRDCREAALNGVWGTAETTTGIFWYELSSDGYIVDSVEMKVRQV